MQGDIIIICHLHTSPFTWETGVLNHNSCIWRPRSPLNPGEQIKKLLGSLLRGCVDHSPSYVQHYVPQNLSPLQVQKRIQFLKYIICFGQHSHHQMLKICLMRKSLLSLVAAAYAVLMLRVCVVVGVLCSSMLYSSLHVTCKGDKFCGT
jgi:hypothetical protein